MQQNKNKHPVKIDTSYFGRPAPQAKELEEAVLGALLVDKNVITAIADILNIDSFYDERHQVVYEAMLQLYAKANPIDLLTVSQELRQMGKLEVVGGSFYLTELANRVASAANVEYHARIVLQKYIARELISIGQQAIEGGYDEQSDIFEELLNIEARIASLTARNGSAIINATKAIIDTLSDKTKVEYLPQPIHKLEEHVPGFFAMDFMLINARPGVGKTSFALQVQYALAKQGYCTAFISIEMPVEHLVNYMATQNANIPSLSLRTKEYTTDEELRIDAFIESLRVKELPFLLFVPENNRIESLLSTMRKMVAMGVKTFFIDYLQQLRTMKDGKPNEVMENVCMYLKEFCKREKVTVVALSQLNADKTNTAGGDGAIRYADASIWLYKSSEDPDTAECLPNSDESSEGYVTFEIKKNRNGGTGKVYLQFDGERKMFINHKTNNDEVPEFL